MWMRVTGWYMDLPFWAKLIVSSLIGAILGSSVMAFLTTYANYWFAFRHGARIPVEGVPFLNLSVAMASLLIYGISAAITTLAFILGTVYAAEYDNRKRKIPHQWTQILLAFVLSLVGGMVLNISLQIVATEGASLRGLIGMLFSVCVVYGMVVGIFLSRFIIRAYSLFSTVITVFLVSNLFAEGRYDSFLRLTRFGGGIATTVQKRDKSELSGYLFLVTEKRVILYNDKESSYLEVPADDVVSFTYAQYPNWKLPAVDYGKQMQYLK